MEFLTPGTKVFLASYENREFIMKCPDCFGKRFLMVILGDDSRVTIACEGCSAGYDPPTGINKLYQASGRVVEATVTGIDVREGKVEYHTTAGYRESYDVFRTREEAEIRAKVVGDEQAHRDLLHFFGKEQPTRKWSWNATYHRREAKNAKQSLAYHTAKLDEAAKHIKEEK